MVLLWPAGNGRKLCRFPELVQVNGVMAANKLVAHALSGQEGGRGSLANDLITISRRKMDDRVLRSPRKASLSITRRQPRRSRDIYRRRLTALGSKDRYTVGMITAGRAFRQAPLLLALLSSLALGLAQQGRIAFIDPAGQLATVAPDGSELRVLTESGRLFQFPAWSPDGAMLAAIGSDAEGGAVYTVTDGVGAVPQELYRSQAEPPFYLYWTPSGRQLGFLANHPSGIGLHIASLQEAESRLRLTGQPFYWQWSADGQELLVHTGFAGPSSRLTFIDAGGEGVGDNLAAPGFFQAPGISASERYIAYSAADVLGGGRLVVQAHPHLDPSEGEAARIEVRHQGLVALGWSPTADLLAFTSPPVPAPFFYGPIFLLDAETGGLELLVAEVAIAFFWSPDGCCIAYFTPVLGGGEQGRPLLLDLAVAEVASGQVRLLATFRPSPLFAAQFLPFFDQYALSHTFWSPGSDALALPMVDDDGHTRIYVVTLSGEKRPVAHGDTPFWSR